MCVRDSGWLMAHLCGRNHICSRDATCVLKALLIIIIKLGYTSPRL